MNKKRKFKTKLLSALLAVFMLAASLPFAGLTAFAGRYGDDFDYFMRENDNIAIRYLGDKASVIVPSELDGYTVTELAAEAFIYKENLTAVTIPDSITLISNYAFIGSDNLKDIYYGGSEKQWNEISIDPDNNDPLFNATIHYNYDGPFFTPTISDMMKSDIFAYRYSLEDGTAEIYGANTIYEPDDENTDLTIPSELDGHTVAVIGVWAFSSSAIKNVTIPNTVTSIGEGAFSQCFYLENITIPESITSIGKEAFGDCLNLTDVYFNGTEEEWNAITIGEYNNPLINANIHFNPVVEEETTDQTADDPATDTNASSSAPAIDPVIMIVIAVAAVICVAVVIIIIIKKKK